MCCFSHHVRRPVTAATGSSQASGRRGAWDLGFHSTGDGALQVLGRGCRGLQGSSKSLLGMPGTDKKPWVEPGAAGLAEGGGGEGAPASSLARGAGGSGRGGQGAGGRTPVHLPPRFPTGGVCGWEGAREDVSALSSREQGVTGS